MAECICSQFSDEDPECPKCHPKKPRESCQSCRYFIGSPPLGPAEYMCRRNPPPFPLTSPSNWCGEFRQGY